MAKKLLIKGSYLILEDTIDGTEIEFPYKDVYYRDYGNVFQFKTLQDSSLNLEFEFSDLLDENGNAWASIDDLKNWLQLNTGTESSDEKPLRVTEQRSTKTAIIAKASNVLASSTTSAPLAVGDLTVDVTDVTGFVIGDYLTIYSVADNRVYFSDILNIVGNTISLDSPLDFAFPSGSEVTAGSYNLAVDGSVTPQVFGVRNPQNEDIPLIFEVTRIIFKCEHSGTGDLSKFGDIAGGLTRGLVCRRVGGVYQNIFNVKTNSDLKNLMYDFDIELAQGNAPNGFAGRFTIEKLGVVLSIGAGEDIQFLVDDDLSGLTSLVIIVQGKEAD